MSKYALYAVGEVVLVVVGILIALQINNANEQRLQREREVGFLENLRDDSEINLAELNKFLVTRKARIASAEQMVRYFEGEPVEKLEDFVYHNIHVQLWQKFYQNNNTYQELVNSGNLGILSNAAIKRELLDLELLYKKMKSDEDHMRFDFEGYVFTPFFDTIDLDPMTKSFVYTATGGQSGAQVPISREDVDKLLKDMRFKNGFVLAIYMNNVINAKFEELITRTEHLVELINNEIVGTP
ncbi:MAG: hypothetical protein GWP67_13195 [Gammaproteobacteria bacterium]|nr:hypothetical protein [Gammaproteobacteria bacterium]